ncbi:MAG: hypothetical protein C4295_12360 [Candidatus Fervidibacterota bacterium]
MLGCTIVVFLLALTSWRGPPCLKTLALSLCIAEMQENSAIAEPLYVLFVPCKMDFDSGGCLAKEGE